MPGQPAQQRPRPRLLPRRNRLVGQPAIEVVRTHRDDPPTRIVGALHRAVRAFAGQEVLAVDVTSVVIKGGPWG